MAELILHLVRHGTHGDLGRRLTGRLSNSPLRPEGWRQARALSEHFAAMGRIDVVQTSPRLRARQTAGVIGDRLGRPCEVACGWDEIDFGAWTGMRFEDLEGNPEWDRWNASRATACPPEGESIAAVSSRVRHQIAALRERDTQAEASKVAVCVTHCDVIRALVTEVRGLDAGRMLDFPVDTGSCTTLVFGNDGARVRAVNEVPS